MSHVADVLSSGAVILTDNGLDGDDFGECDVFAQVIRIRPTLCDSAKRETFIHELLHCCCSAAGTRETEKYDEEGFV